jgi:hypothetical protein
MQNVTTLQASANEQAKMQSLTQNYTGNTKIMYKV